MTNAATNGKNKFLADVPSEIRELLDWHEAREVRCNPGPKLTEFANRFLGGMIEVIGRQSPDGDVGSSTPGESCGPVR